MNLPLDISRIMDNTDKLEFLVGRTFIPGSKKLLGPFIHAACPELDSQLMYLIAAYSTSHVPRTSKSNGWSGSSSNGEADAMALTRSRGL